MTMDRTDDRQRNDDSLAIQVWAGAGIKVCVAPWLDSFLYGIGGDGVHDRVGVWHGSIDDLLTMLLTQLGLCRQGNGIVTDVRAACGGEYRGA